MALFWGPSSGCICLALRVMYPDDKVYYFDDEISIILTLALLWWVCRQFSMNGYRLRVWVGSDGIMFVSCFSVSIVVSGFSYAAQSLRCLLRGWCVLGSLCRFAPICENMLTLSCFWRWLQVCISGGLFLGTSIVTSVPASGLFRLSKYTLYVSCPVFFVWWGTISTMSVYLVCKLTFHHLHNPCFMCFVVINVIVWKLAL